MQIAPDVNGRAYSAGLDARPIGLASIMSRNRAVVFWGIVALGVALRLYGIGAYSLVVDEYGSIVEGQRVGLNWNSILYSIVMHFWLPLGSSEFWLRLPAAIFGMATVPVLFKVGEKFDGWRTAAVVALLAATSPFNIYHSQEVRFYSLFMLASAVFLLATVHYVGSERKGRQSLWVIAAGALLLVTHFLGFIAVYAQSAATFLAAKRRTWPTVIAITIGLPLLIFGLPLWGPVRGFLVYLYQTLGNAEAQSTAMTPVSLVSAAKIAFAGFTFVFGYHVYPLRLVLVTAGAALGMFLFACGIARLVKEKRWAALAVTNAFAVIGIYVVLDSLGGRLASGVSPRHVAFVWPVFLLVLALGLTRFQKTVFKLLLAAMLTVNVVSLAGAWTKDWTYGVATDYRTAAEYASRWASPDTLLVYSPHAVQPTYFYFPENLRKSDWYSYSQNRDGSMSTYQRVIVVSDDWRPDHRAAVNDVLKRLDENYTCVDGRAEYPLFEYVFDRRAASNTSGQAPVGGQLPLLPTIYGLEFQDLKLPVAVSAKGTKLQVIGASQLPQFDANRSMTVSAAVEGKRRLILLTSAVLDQELADGAAVAELVLESDRGIVQTIPLRVGSETNVWDRDCAAEAPCRTVIHWHKHMAMVGQNAYRGAWRDFQAGIHAVAIDLPPNANAKKISLHYV